MNLVDDCSIDGAAVKCEIVLTVGQPISSLPPSSSSDSFESSIDFELEIAKTCILKLSRDILSLFLFLTLYFLFSIL